DLAQPVRDGGGEVRGVVIGSLALESFQDLLTSASITPRALLTVTDRNRAVVARSRGAEEWIGRVLPPENVREEGVEPGVAITRAEDAEGRPTTFARVEIPAVGWRVFAGLPDSMIYGPARRAAARNLVITLPLLLLALALGAGLYRRVGGSLRGLVAGVATAGPDAPVPEEGPEEVRAVARALNQTLEARARAEDAERQAKERYRSILDNAVFGIYLSSADGRVLEVNPALAALLGFDSADELREAGMESVYADPSIRSRLVEEHWPTRKPIRGEELEWRRRDGTPITVRLNGKIVDAAGDEPFFEVIVEDITEQRALEEEYRHTQKMEAVGRLAGGVAHDINNVLTAVLGHATLLQSRTTDDEEATSGAAEIVAAARRASALTRQLLAFSRKEVIQPRLLDLNEVVDEIQRMVRRLIGEDVSLVVRLQPELPPVKADPGQMEQVILNLLINARDALPHGGRVEVTTSWTPPGVDDIERAPGGWVKLEVSDSGTGMAAEVRDRIFEPFFTTKPPGEGTGLGLSTVYAIVTQGGGTIHVESEPGSGAAFVVSFPAAEARPVEDTVEAPPDDGERGRGTILVAEDEPSVRDVVRRVLERSGYRVVTAADGVEALELERGGEESFDLLLTDVVMPGMNGLELADRIAQTLPGLPVLFMSGYNESEALRARTREDPGIFLAKPFSPDELLERVRERLASSGARTPAG
ncbi:MAG: response regulator, partial [Gemmatimonadetes bacterium]|nr:response regulator [Gemmatimonadota bacterium]